MTRRERVGVIFLGKILGVMAALGTLGLFYFLFETAAGASPAQTAIKAADTINPINTMWVLVTAFLVFFMQAGFMGLEAGFADHICKVINLFSRGFRLHHDNHVRLLSGFQAAISSQV